MPRPQSPLTKLILSLPLDLSTAEVVEKAKAQGFATNPENVTQVRSRARAAAKAAKQSGATKAAPPVASPPPTTKPAATKSAKKTVAKPKTAPKVVAPSAPAAAPAGAAGRSRSEFIRSLPATMPVNDVVAKAKAAGIELRAHLVYEVRRADRLRKAPAPKKASKPVAAPAAHAPAPKKLAAPNAHAEPAAHGRVSPEDLLRAVAAEVGLARAISVLEEQRRQVLRVLAR